jgi:hypothetical protein
MSKAQYWIARSTFQSENCVVGPDPDFAGKAYQIAFGERVGSDYPEDLRLPMSRSSPGKHTPDALHNTMSFLLTSHRLAEILRPEVGEEVEFLPFELVNHKKKVVPGFGFIVNLIGTVECVDSGTTTGRRSVMKPDKLMSISVLTLDPKRIPKGAKLFRIGEKPDVLIIRSDLRETLEKQKVTGLSFFELGRPLPPMAI